jgi:dienelactone hydrolase
VPHIARRSFVAFPALAAQTTPARRASGYVDWSWERWREITGETRPSLVTDQTGVAGLADLLMHGGRKVSAASEWPARRDDLQRAVLAILGESPGVKPPLAARVLDEAALATHTRRKLVFQSEPGEFIPAYLLLPKNARGRRPAVVCPHQTVQSGKDEPAGLAGNPALHMAVHLVERGYVTFTYDAACFGERHNAATGHYGEAIPFYRRHPRWSMMGKMAWDLSRAVDYLQTLDAVDPARIGSIGHSHGGYTTLFAMALDGRIAAGVSSCGFDTFRYDGNTWRWSHATALMPRLGFYITSPYLRMGFYGGVPDSETVQTPLDLHFALALIAPRPLFLTTSDEDAIFPNAGWSLRQALARLEPVYRLLGSGDRLGSYLFRGGHSFPPDAANLAYGWLGRWLGGVESQQSRD